MYISAPLKDPKECELRTFSYEARVIGKRSEVRFETPVFVLTPAELEAERRNAFEAGAHFGCGYPDSSYIEDGRTTDAFADYLKSVERDDK